MKIKIHIKALEVINGKNNINIIIININIT